MKLIKFLQRYLMDLPKIIWFNFKHFPLKVAIKLPVLLHKTELMGGGKFIIDSSTPIRTGMIRIGHRHVSHFRDTGAILDNKGTIIFKGTCRLGNSCAVSVGKNAELVMGDGFCATADVRVVCRKHIHIGRDVLVGWSAIIMDTNFHRLKDKNGVFTDDGYSDVNIGNDNWIASGCKIMQDTKTPANAVIAANAVLNRDYTDWGRYILIGGAPAKLLKKDIYWDRSDDLPLYCLVTK
jgi:acetyltransferase-like isoleucine patch superfamily enzyme